MLNAGGVAGVLYLPSHLIFSAFPAALEAEGRVAHRAADPLMAKAEVLWKE